MNKPTMERVRRLLSWMQEKGLCAFITPSTDPHSGEYVPDRWKSREWISGFTGSAGTAVVTLDSTALWTDSRYFLQAAEQIKGTDYVLMKDKIEGTPSICQWIAAQLSGDGRAKVGVDGCCYTASDVDALEREFEELGAPVTLVTEFDPYDTIWTNRPPIPTNPVEIQPLEYAGETTSSKIARIRKAVAQHGADALVVSMLDEVAWTLNLRGTDVECTPLFVSYLVVTDEQATLYVKHEKLTDEVRSYLASEGIGIREYGDVFRDLAATEKRVMMQPDKTNDRIRRAVRHRVEAECPVSRMKIMKNEAEIRGFHTAMVEDGIAMVKWMKWVVPAVAAGGQTELSLSARLEAFRAERKGFRGISFNSIMGYAAHGAVVHYEPTPDTDIPVLPKGLLLIDSGGQYQGGTTDITRTIPLGDLTDQERRDYTLVLRGFINLGRVVFPRGTYGTQLDALARTAMWEYGLNYLHGTGHGVGSYLSVHEGPHQFRMNYMPTPLVPGMTITDEPGIYATGSHGVRHENMMLVVDAFTGEAGGVPTPFYKFEHLTLCPILTSPIVVGMLQSEERKWFNDYQQMVYDKLAPRLDEDHRAWLFEATRPI